MPKKRARESADDDEEEEEFEEQDCEESKDGDMSYDEDEKGVSEKKEEKKEKKKKKKSSSSDEEEPTDARGKIHHYLQTNCRPFGLCQVLAKTQVERGVAEAMLDQLIRNELVASKTIGNNKIYWSVEHQACSIDEIEGYQKKAADYKTQMSQIEKEITTIAKKTKALLAQPTNVELDENLIQAESILNEITSKVETATSRGTITKPQMQQATKEHNNLLSTWIQRKRACHEIIDDLSEDLDMTKKTFIAHIEEFSTFETDEDFSKIPLPPPKPGPLATSKKFNYVRRPAYRK